MTYTHDEILAAFKEHGRDAKKIAAALQVSERTVRRWRSRLDRAFDDALPVQQGCIEAPDKRRVKLFGRRFVFTAAQNNTPVHERFLRALEVFCNKNDARLKVAKITYNKEGFQNLDKTREGLWYDPQLEDYFMSEAAEITKGGARCTPLVWCGELDILPTAVRPLTGLETYTRDASGIVPHTKLCMHSVPTPLSSPTKFMYTTGAVTQRNYIPRKTGQKADFCHVFGALYVEVTSTGEWFARQLVANEQGDFYDLDAHYSAEGCIYGLSADSITLGDIHAPRVSKQALAAARKLIAALQPKYLVLHDLIDFYSRSHWNKSDPHFMYRAQAKTVEAEFMSAGLVLDDLITYMPDTGYLIVAPSNHNYAFYQWLKDPAGFRDPVNMRLWLEANLDMCMAIEHDVPEYSSITYQRQVLKHVEDTAHKRIKFLTLGDSFMHNEIELGMHGHLGPNGTRGNIENLGKIGVKSTIGHVHAAGIRDGVFSAGVTSKLDLEYNRGPSNWSHSHVVQYKNGKRAIVTCIGEDWRA